MPYRQGQGEEGCRVGRLGWKVCSQRRAFLGDGVAIGLVFEATEVDLDVLVAAEETRAGEGG